MSENPYTATRMLGQAKWFALAKAGIAVVSLLTQLVLVRRLAVTDYVSYTIFVAATGVLVFVTMCGMDRVAYRFLPPLRAARRWRELGVTMAGMLAVRLAVMLVLLGVLAVGGRTLLPDQLADALAGIPLQCVLYALAQAGTDSLVIFCNSVGQQRLQAGLFLLAGAVRLAGVSAAASLDALMVANVFGWTELALAAALCAVVAGDILRARRLAEVGAWRFGFSLRALVGDAAGTQAAYLLGLPFKGALLKLLVGAVSPPLVTAAFGFFQTLSDRAYQFMPIFMLKGLAEPALANDFALRGDVVRVRRSVSLMLRLNVVLVCLGVALLLGVGTPLIDWITQDRYGSQSMLAVLIALQAIGLALGESLFFAMNPVGRIAVHNRLWLLGALPFLLLLALAASTRQAWALVLAATLPYFAIFAWLRWIVREPVLGPGFGIPWLVSLRLSIATVLAALAGRITLLLPASHVTILCAALFVVLAFAMSLRAVGVLQREETAAIGSLSPRLAQLMRPFSAP